MEHTFTFESDHFSSDGETCDEIEVTIDIWCHSDDGDYGWEDMVLWNKTTDKEVKIEDFPKEEAAKIEKLADDAAYDKASDAYQSYCESEGDRAYDAWKDRMMEEGE